MSAELRNTTESPHIAVQKSGWTPDATPTYGRIASRGRNPFGFLSRSAQGASLALVIGGGAAGAISEIDQAGATYQNPAYTLDISQAFLGGASFSVARAGDDAGFADALSEQVAQIMAKTAQDTTVVENVPVIQAEVAPAVTRSSQLTIEQAQEAWDLEDNQRDSNTTVMVTKPGTLDWAVEDKLIKMGVKVDPNTRWADYTTALIADQGKTPADYAIINPGPVNLKVGPRAAAAYIKADVVLPENIKANMKPAATNTTPAGAVAIPGIDLPIDIVVAPARVELPQVFPEDLFAEAARLGYAAPIADNKPATTVATATVNNPPAEAPAAAAVEGSITKGFDAAKSYRVKEVRIETRGAVLVLESAGDKTVGLAFPTGNVADSRLLKELITSGKTVWLEKGTAAQKSLSQFENFRFLAHDGTQFDFYGSTKSVPLTFELPRAAAASVVDYEAEFQDLMARGGGGSLRNQESPKPPVAPSNDKAVARIDIANTTFESGAITLRPTEKIDLINGTYFLRGNGSEAKPDGKIFLVIEKAGDNPKEQLKKEEASARKMIEITGRGLTPDEFTQFIKKQEDSMLPIMISVTNSEGKIALNRMSEDEIKKILGLDDADISTFAWIMKWIISPALAAASLPAIWYLMNHPNILLLRRRASDEERRRRLERTRGVEAWRLAR